MNRLPSELHRLYSAQTSTDPGTVPEECRLIDSAGQVRAMVLSLARPADWQALAKVWQGVQVDLDLPAPAIAVSGTDAYQLWFSLAQPLPAAQALVFLESLRLRYLGDIKPQRVGLMPSLDGASLPQWLHASTVPALQASGYWSAFVAPELAPVFADEPWLETAPNPEGQSSLLARLSSIPLADFELALQGLSTAQASAPGAPASMPAAPDAVASPMGQRKAAAGPWLDPKSFLLEVMNNDAVELRLRIEAAKALLPHVDTTGPVPGVPQP
jgi:hypothetical protein